MKMPEIVARQAAFKTDLLARQTALRAEIEALETRLSASHPEVIKAIGRLSESPKKHFVTSTLVKRRDVLAALIGKPNSTASAPKAAVDATELGAAIKTVIATHPAAGQEILSGIQRGIEKLTGKERAAAAFNKQLPGGVPKPRGIVPVLPVSAIAANKLKFSKAIAEVDQQIKAAAKTGKISQELISRRRQLDSDWLAANRASSSNK